MVRMITAAAVLTIAGSAMAGPLGSYWVEVDNSTNLNGSATGFENSWRTFDLYVDLEVGDIIYAADFGIAGPNTGITTDGAIYVGDPPFASDSIADNVSFGGFVADLEYSSAVTVNGGAISFAQAMDWSPAGVTGAWFVNPGQTGAGGPNGAEDMWLARVTVSADANFLGGFAFVSGDDINGVDFGGQVPATGVFEVPNAIPTPGALALFGLAGAAAIRRRR